MWQMKSKKIWALLVALIMTAVVIFGLAFYINSSMKADEISISDAEKIVNAQYDKLAQTKALKYVASNNTIKVNGISYGEKKDIILNCRVDTLDIHSAISPYYNKFFTACQPF